MRARLVLLSTLLFACGAASSERVIVRIDASATAREREITEEGVKRWAPYTLAERTPLVDDSGEWVIIFTSAERPGLEPPVGGRACRWEGPRCPRSRSIWIRRGYSESTTRDMVTHEVGHAMGLDHVSDPGVMHPNTGPEITEADIEECRSAGACGSINVRTEQP